jgi:hypothetical protein
MSTQVITTLINTYNTTYVYHINTYNTTYVYHINTYKQPINTSNDGHNVDTADALVTTIPIALLSADDTTAIDETGKMVYVTNIPLYTP